MQGLPNLSAVDGVQEHSYSGFSIRTYGPSILGKGNICLLVRNHELSRE